MITYNYLTKPLGSLRFSVLLLSSIKKLPFKGQKCWEMPFLVFCFQIFSRSEGRCLTHPWLQSPPLQRTGFHPSNASPRISKYKLLKIFALPQFFRACYGSVLPIANRPYYGFRSHLHGYANMHVRNNSVCIGICVEIA